MESRAKRTWRALTGLGIALEAGGLVLALLSCLKDALVNERVSLQTFGPIQIGGTIAGILIFVVGLQLVIMGTFYFARTMEH